MRAPIRAMRSLTFSAIERFCHCSSRMGLDSARSLANIASICLANACPRMTALISLFSRKLR